eukprot:scaffold23826_cov60-Phaeocystis_antarctica.AAC.1
MGLGSGESGGLGARGGRTGAEATHDRAHVRSWGSSSVGGLRLVVYGFTGGARVAQEVSQYGIK